MKLKRLIVPLIITFILAAGTVGVVYAATSTIDGTKYTHPSWYSSSTYKLFHGVDVSYWQGTNINWSKVKKSGVDFAFLRCGRSDADSGSHYKDSTFATNMKNAFAAGVNVGVYYWSEATTTTEAKSEAAYVVSMLKAYKVKVTMPVVMDYEFASGYRSTAAYNKWVKAYGVTYARNRIASNAKAFMDVVYAAGYTPVLYSYRSMVDGSSRKFNMSFVNTGSKYQFWLAQYSTNNSYAGKMNFWQYSSEGSVSGISGDVDRNFWYYNNAAEVTRTGTTSIKTCTVSLGTTSYAYSGAVNTPAVTVTAGDGTVLTENTDYTVSYFRNVKAGRAYALIRGINSYSNAQIVSFEIGSRDLTSSSVTVSAISDSSYTGKAICPSPTVKYGTTTLTKGTDYTLSYSGNVNAGTATVTITGKGNCSGTIKKTFKILKITPTITTSQSRYAYVRGTTFSLNASTTSGKLTFGSSDTALAGVSSAGTVTTGNTSGVATITITCPETANTSKVTRTVTVGVVAKPGTPYLTKLAKIKTGYFRAYWRQVPYAHGYLVKYSKYSDFRVGGYYRVTSGSITAATVYDKFSGDYCYVKVKTYKKINGLYVYSKYSNSRKIRIR